MWIGVWMRGEALEDRPLCLLVHYLVCLNVLCLVAAQIVLFLLSGGTRSVGLAWALGSGLLIALHTAFAFLFAWIDGEEIGFGGGVDGGGIAGGTGDGSDGGSAGDGGGA